MPPNIAPQKFSHISEWEISPLSTGIPVRYSHAKKMKSGYNILSLADSQNVRNSYVLLYSNVKAPTPFCYWFAIPTKNLLSQNLYTILQWSESFLSMQQKKERHFRISLSRCVRDSNPWPHAWQACILTNWTNAPLSFSFVAFSLDCGCKGRRFFQTYKLFGCFFSNFFQ